MECPLCMNEIKPREAIATVNGLSVHLKCYEHETLKRTISAMKPGNRPGYFSN